MSFDLEESKLKIEISKRNPKIVLLQFPEGLKPEATRIANLVEKAGALPIVSADPCYGACDLAISGARLLCADLIIHFGHSSMDTSDDVPIIFIEAKTKIKIKDVITTSLSYLKPWTKIGLVTTVQHINQLVDAKKILENAGKTVFVGNAGKTKYAGQILGCNFSNAQLVSEKVDSFLFIGGGRFHAIGLALATEKPTIVADPYTQIVYPIHDQVRKIIMQRWGNLSEAKLAKSFGVLISMKSGQFNLTESIEIKEKLEKHGLNVTLFALREIIPSTLMQFPTIDAFVNTGCPRISLDDSPVFDKPILSINETLVLLGEIKWENLFRKGWFENVI
ncbi:diphthamide biosynthesis enzyme Dph2 [Candidatus Bathyarchaeota archaeon]|nr:diphthamide biosynthesis enzyme Dph2 [Candidatus Bathyarchaeota archaeon]